MSPLEGIADVLAESVHVAEVPRTDIHAFRILSARRYAAGNYSVFSTNLWYTFKSRFRVMAQVRAIAPESPAGLSSAQ